VITDQDKLLEIHLRLADLQRDQLQNLSEAELHLREVLILDERHEDAYVGIETILEEQERWHDLVEILEQRHAIFANDLEARDLLLRMARLQEEKLEDGFSAVDTYGRVMHLEPQDPVACEAVERLLRLQERWEDLNAHLERLIDLCTDPGDLVDLKMRLSAVVAEEMGDGLRAIELYREVLDIDLENSEALGALETMFDDEFFDHRSVVAGILDPIFRRDEAWGRLVEVLFVRSETEAEPSQGIDFLKDAAQVAENLLGDLELAFETSMRLFAIEPADETIRRSLERLTVRLGRWEDLAAGYEATLQDNFSIDDMTRATLLTELAVLFEQRLGRLEDAQRVFHEVLQTDVENERAIDALERIIMRREEWHELADLYQQRVEVEFNEDRQRHWLEKLAVLYEDVLGDTNSAVDVHGRIMAMAPTDADTQKTLVRLLSYARRWHDVADLYRQRVDYAKDPQEIIEYRFELARLLEGEVGQIDEALTIYREILDVEPDHLETLRALEGMRRDLAGRDDDVRMERRAVIELLLNHYDEGRHWQRMRELYQELVTLAEDPAAHVQLLVQQAQLVIRVSQDSSERTQALGYLAEAFCIDSANEEIAELIDVLAEDLDGWHRVIQVYLAGLQNTDEPEDHARLLLAIASMYEGPLEDEESAIAAYQQVAELDVGSERALDRLQTIYAELELWLPLVEILEKRLENEYDGSARHRLLKRIGSIYDETLHKPLEAIRFYDELRQEDPADISYIVILERLYEQAGDYEGLVGLLEKKVDIVEDDGIRVRALKKLAGTLDDILERAEDALVVYRALLAIDENDLASVRASSRLFEQTEQWVELLDMLRIEKDFAGGLEETNSIECRMGIVLQHKLDSPVEALARYSGVIERDAGHNGARESLIQLLEVPQTREEASQLLKKAFRAVKDWDSLEEIYGREVDYLEDPLRRGEVFVELAQLQEETFEQPQKAFMTLGRAFRELPELKFVRQDLERIVHTMGNYDELVAILEDAVDAGFDDFDVSREVRLRLGQIYFDELDEIDEAIRHFDAVLQIEEYDETALDYLNRLYQQQRDWPKLAEILERKMAVVSPEDISQVCFQLGYLREVFFEQGQDALDLYRRVLIDEPHHGGVIEGLERLVEDEELRRDIFGLLEPIYQELGAHGKLVHLYKLKLSVADHSAERAELQKQIATLEIDELGHVDIGYAFLGRALREDPHDMEVQDKLESLALDHGLYEQLCALYEEVIADLADPVRIVELALRAAQWSVEELGESQAAATLYKRVLEIESEHEIALNSLEAIARESESIEDLVIVLNRKAEVVFDPDQRREIFIELGRLRTGTGAYAEAIEAYEQALIIDESDVEIMKVLVGLFEVEERYDKLVDVLERLTHHLYEPEEQLQLFMRIGSYCTVFLKEFDRGLSAYQRAHDLQPENRDILLALEELYEASEQWDELRAILASQMDMAEDDEERVGIYVRKARLQYERFNDTEAAIDDYQRAFTLRSDHPLVIDSLQRLYRKEERWQELVDLFNYVLSSLDEESQDRRVALMVDVADVYQAHLGDEDRAMAYLTSVLEAEPLHESALEVLLSIYTRQGQWEAVLELMERQFEAASSAERRIELLLKRGEIFDQKLERHDEAAATYWAIIENVPLHEEGLAALHDLYKRLGAHDGLYDLLEHRAAQSESEDEGIALYLEMGELARKYLAQTPERRIAALQRAYALRREDLTIVEPLLDALIAGNLFDEAEPLLAEVIETLTAQRQMREVVRFHHLQGKLIEQKGDLDGALAAYETAHKIDATYIPNLLSLGKLVFKKEDWEHATKIFQILLLHQMNIKDNDDKVEVYYHFGEIRRRTGDARGAKDMFNRALRIDTHHAPSRQAMSEL
ncbi:MAG: hypothetical protein ACNA8W_08060, partial [Bradymonadaceae bacterium]